MLIIILSMLFIILDQLSKYLIINYLTSDLTIIKNILYLKYIQNEGAAFSILTGQRIFLIIITLVIIGLIVYYIKRNKVCNKLNLTAFAMIIGGSIGNLIDRIVRGYVIDFISIKIFKYNFPIFNVADTLICIGVFILIFTSFRKENKNDNNRSNKRN